MQICKRLCWVIIIIMWGSPYALLAQEETPPPDYFVEAFVSDSMPYVGEQILYSFRYYAYTLPPNLQENLPEFEGFWLGEVDLVGNNVDTIQNRQYIVGELYAEISPLSDGVITIPPSNLFIPESVFNNRVDLDTSSVTVQVRPLPENAPESFNGAVGQYTASLEATPMSITLGEPVTLTLTIDGTGDLERLLAPDLSEIAGWRVFANPPQYTLSAVSGIRLGQKIFQWLLIPEQSGTQTFPSIEFTYFDPEEEVYKSESFDPFTINVLTGQDNRTSLAERDQTNVDTDVAIQLLPITGAISNETGQPSEMFWSLWIIAPLVMISSGAWMILRRYRSRQHAKYKRLNALRHALVSLKGLQSAPSVKISIETPKVIYTYFSDKTGQSVGYHNFIQLLQNHNLPRGFIETLDEYLTEAAAGRYLPANTQIDMQPLIIQLVSTLKLIDEVWIDPS